jgi:hypothetical protein
MKPDPSFNDDMKFMPLQAADLRAWYSHRCLGSSAPPRGRLWEELDRIVHLPMHSERKDLHFMLHGVGLSLRASHKMALNVAARMKGHGIRLPSGRRL